jgi:hypothetical protein
MRGSETLGQLAELGAFDLQGSCPPLPIQTSTTGSIPGYGVTKSHGIVFVQLAHRWKGLGTTESTHFDPGLNPLYYWHFRPSDSSVALSG